MTRKLELFISVNDTRPIDIYKILLAGLFFSIVPLGLIFGFFGYFGFNVITLNGEQVFGIKAIAVGLLTSCIVSVIIAVLVGTFCCVGLYIYSQIKELYVKVIGLARIQKNDKPQ
ncbi:hypothetical protein [Buttiauxella sp.]|uniref:hypothetical protein n=1 Tax=Buttiauxella sp. TaxID=1972222 RepID=UPI003C71570C